MSELLLEIAANSLGSALAAQAGGADRIELCENLGEGGTTPSYGTLARVRERLSIPVFALVRPRGGDFLYDADELEVMKRDIETCALLGCDGVVIGALDAEGDVDQASCRELIAAAGTMSVTFHRAFDATRDQVQALETIIALGCGRNVGDIATMCGFRKRIAARFCLAEHGHVGCVNGASVVTKRV